MNSGLTLEELADCLPGDVGRLDDSRSRLLCVQEVLRTLTDSSHGLTIGEIREIIGLRSWQSGHVPSEPSVLADVHALIDANLESLEIARPSRGENVGFRCVGRTLTGSQARLLLNSIRTCKFITQDECRDLCEAVEGLLSVYEQDRVVADVYVDERARPSEAKTFEAADVIIRAIDAGKKITFEYIYYGFDGKEHNVVTDSGQASYIETPINMIFGFGNYYVETWPASIDPNSPRKHFSRRIDRMRNVAISEECAETTKEISELKKTVKERTSQTFDMFGDGVKRDLFLKVDQNAVNAVFAHFGHNCKFEHVEELPSGHMRGFIRVAVQLSPTFYRWLCGMGDMVTIASPQNEIWANRGSWGKGSAKRSYKKLLQDYEAAIDGYVGHLYRALSPYVEASE